MFFPLAFDDFVHQYPGISLAMPLLLSVANFGLILKYNNLLSLGLAQTGPHNLGPLNDRVSYEGVFVTPDKEHPVELDSVAFGNTEALNFYCLLWGYLVLFAAYLDDRVNLLTSLYTKRGF
jgi:hypothetical protein